MTYSRLTPLRYPGGKAKLLSKIVPHFPSKFKEYREPFLGGGSVLLALLQKSNQNNIYKVQVNDLNINVHIFWKELQNNGELLIKNIQNIYDKYKKEENGKELYYILKSQENTDSLQLATRFFVLNRITFSGTIDSGGYSEESFQKRFVQSSIDRLKKIHPLIQNCVIRNEDYSSLVQEPGNDVFIYLDPPYLSAKKSRLYGTRGDLHLLFSHDELFVNLTKCKHQWLMTIDYSPDIVKKYENIANLYQINGIHYGMRNAGDKNTRDDELLIANYELEGLSKINK